MTRRTGGWGGNDERSVLKRRARAVEGSMGLQQFYPNLMNNTVGYNPDAGGKSTNQKHRKLEVSIRKSQKIYNQWNLEGQCFFCVRLLVS